MITLNKEAKAAVEAIMSLAALPEAQRAEVLKSLSQVKGLPEVGNIADYIYTPAAPTSYSGLNMDALKSVPGPNRIINIHFAQGE